MSAARPDTWMPLYIGDYLADTMHLTRDQHGAYFLLIMAYWRRGEALPDDDACLAVIAKSTPIEWKRLRSVMASFFRIGDGLWRHKRIDAELTHAQQMTNKRANAGRASAAAKRQHKANTCSTCVPGVLPTNDEQTGLPSPSPSEAKASGATAPPDPSKELFDAGVHLLTNAGKSEQQARTLIGKWRKDLTDPELAKLIAQAASKTEPVAWLQKAVNSAAEREKAPNGRAWL